jgi:hypothetical protein
LTPTLSTTLGTFDDSKNARYTAGGKRILNWLIYYDGTTAYVNRWVTPESANDNNYLPDLDTPPETWITGSGTWTAPRSKYYTIEMVAHGEGGGNIISGGGAGAYGRKRILINAGDTWTATLATAALGNTTFSDGTTTLTVQNADNSGLRGGTEPTGFDVNCRGTSGITGVSGTAGGGGAPSAFGGGGYGGDIIVLNGGAGSIGAGGGGANTAGYTRGAGGSGAIHIIG